MRNFLLVVVACISCLGFLTGCKDSPVSELKKDADRYMKQDLEFIQQAVRHRSPDVQKVDIIGNSVVYTHIFNGIIDVKTYTYDGDVCVKVERVYTFPNQMRALRHYRRAVERADLYDDIKLIGNEVRYNLKQQQHELETKGLTKEQLKQKFDKQIADAKADMKHAGKCIENDLDCCRRKAK